MRGQHGTVQRCDDAAGQEPGQQHGHQRCDNRDRDDAGNGAVVVVSGFSRSGFGIVRIECHQFVQLLAHLIRAVLDPRIDQRAHLIQFVLLRQLQHLGLGLHVAVQRDGERLVQLRFFVTGGQRGVTRLCATQLVDQYANTRLGFLQGRRITVDQNPERQNSHAQDVLGHVAEKADTGQMGGTHVDGGLADDGHAVDGEHTEHDDQQGNEGKTQESARRDIQITQ
ncbi:hypothetical protein D3C87_1165160 [compost metagenome]